MQKMQSFLGAKKRISKKMSKMFFKILEHKKPKGKIRRFCRPYFGQKLNL